MTTVLKGITWEHARGYGSVAAAAEAYREVAPDVEVRWEFRSLLAFGDQGLDELAVDYDLLVIDHPHIPFAAERGLLLPLDGAGHDAELAEVAAQSVGVSHDSYRHPDRDGRMRQWGLATDAASQVAAWRPDLLDAPPRTWDEVLALAADGRVLWPYKPVDAFSSLVSVAASQGTEAMREPGVFLPREAAREALAVLRRLAELVPGDNRGFNPIEVADRLATGDRYAYSPLLFGYSNYSREGFAERRLAYVDVPAGPEGVRGALLGGAGIAVSARTAHPAEAVAHAFWLDSAEVQQGVYFDGGGQPGNAVAWEADRTNDLTLDFFRGTRQTLETAYLRPRHADYPELQNELGPVITAALTGELTDDELITRLDEATARYLGDDRTEH